MNEKKYIKAIEYAKRIITNDEFYENAYLIAIKSYFALKQRKSAIDLYKKLEDILRKELHTIPSVEIRKLLAIQGQDNSRSTTDAALLIESDTEDTLKSWDRNKIIEQLKEGGILVAPIGSRQIQSLVAFQKTNNKLKIVEEIPGFVFVRFVQ